MADASDSKSDAGNSVWVQVPSPASIKDGVNGRFTPSFIDAKKKGLE